MKTIKQIVKEMILCLHLATHPFVRRELVYEMINGGGINYYLGCPKCGGLAEIERYKALDLKKTHNLIHINEFEENWTSQKKY